MAGFAQVTILPSIENNRRPAESDLLKPLTMPSPLNHLEKNHSLSPWLLCLFYLLFLLFLPANNGRSFAEISPASADPMVNQTRQNYKAAKDYYYRLERDATIGKERRNWLTGARNFRRIYLADSKGPLASSSLYMMARMYRRMYQNFNLPIDLDESLGYFNDVSSLFPGDKLADDALFNSAEIYLQEKDDGDQAAKLYLKVIKNFPKGDKYAKSLNRLRELEKTKNIPLPEQFTRSNSIHHLVNVLPVKYWSSDDYTRVVISSSAPVHYSASLLEQNSNQPRRLYIDFAQSYIPPKFRSPIPIEDGLLRQVRTGQFTDNTVRVVLDIESISDYKIFSLKDPFRVVIDVHGQKKQKTQLKSVTGKPEVTTKKTDGKKRPQSTAFISLEDRKKTKPVAKTTEKVRTMDSSLSLAQQLGLGVQKIVIDPGHGGKDPGAMAFGLKEKDIVLKVAKQTASVLRQEYNYDVVLTRNRDISLPLEERTAIANTENADLFVSIHVNAHPQQFVKGIETFYLNLATNSEAMRVAALENATSTHNISELQDILSNLMKNSKIQESSQLAEYVQSNIVSGLEQDGYKVKNLGVKQAPFYVLIGAEMPAVLAEISFITNPQEAALLKQEKYLNEIGEQIAAGVAAYVEKRTTAALRL